jgi:hypothetical protein
LPGGRGAGPGQPSGFVVIDRVGNVLAVFVMNGTNLTLRTPAAPDGNSTDLQNLSLPAPAALAGGISKTLTAAYFSSMGAAFSSRTANDIVQETFPPSATTRGLESGPLFSVSSANCPARRVVALSDHGRHPAAARLAPIPALSAYKNGVVVGAVGAGDGFRLRHRIYGQRSAPRRRRAGGDHRLRAQSRNPRHRFSVDGTLLRYSDATTADQQPGTAPAFGTINGVAGTPPVPATPTPSVAGTARGSEARARPAAGAEFPAFRKPGVNGAGVSYPVIAGTDAGTVGTALSAVEVRNLLEQAPWCSGGARQLRFRSTIGRRTRSWWSPPGRDPGPIRGPDALVDAIDAVPQKARTTAFSQPVAASDLSPIRRRRRRLCLLSHLPGRPPR